MNIAFSNKKKNPIIIIIIIINRTTWTALLYTWPHLDAHVQKCFLEMTRHGFFSSDHFKHGEAK